METQPRRDLSLDFLKGTAVISMIATHVNAFFYNGQLGWMNFWTWWGSTICFVTFVFAYGLGYGLRLTRGPLDRRDTLRRLATLLFGYLGVAAWTYWIWFGNPPTLTGLGKVFLLQEIPAFTEFMLAFFFYGIGLLVFQKWIAAALRRVWVLPTVGLFAYLASRLLYPIPVENYYLANLKGLLVGNLDWNRWGLVSYFVVFALGLTFGYHLLKSLKRSAWQIGLFALTALGVFSLTRAGFYSERWPPSVLYLLWGLAYSLGALSLWDRIRPRIRSLLAPVVNIGHYALDYFVLHTVLVVTGAEILGYRRFDYLPTIAIFFGVLLTNYLVSRFFRRYPSPT